MFCTESSFSLPQWFLPLCRATARVTTGQRKSLDQVEEVQQKQGEDGGTYWTYDHISQVCLVADHTSSFVSGCSDTQGCPMFASALSHIPLGLRPAQPGGIGCYDEHTSSLRLA